MLLFSGEYIILSRFCCVYFASGYALWDSTPPKIILLCLGKIQQTMTTVTRRGLQKANLTDASIWGWVVLLVPDASSVWRNTGHHLNKFIYAWRRFNEKLAATSMCDTCEQSYSKTYTHRRIHFPLCLPIFTTWGLLVNKAFNGVETKLWGRWLAEVNQVMRWACVL